MASLVESRSLFFLLFIPPSPQWSEYSNMSNTQLACYSSLQEHLQMKIPHLKHIKFLKYFPLK